MASTLKFDTWQSTAGVAKQAIIQIINWQSPYGEVTVAANGSGSLGTQTIAVQSNSRLYVHWWTSQYTSIPNNTSWNGKVIPKINGSYFPYAEDDAFNHQFYDDAASGARLRHVYSSFVVSNNLTAGTYTIELVCSAYNQIVTFNYQSGTPSSSPSNNRRSRMVIMEIAG
jgi:hypothetical protein